MKVGRNETCPCGSGRKFKKCHLISGAGGDAKKLAEFWKTQWALTDIPPVWWKRWYIAVVLWFSPSRI
jgi:hypothetical protein